MICDRYWREGVVLVERGLADLHRETCHDCQRAHAARDEIVRALPAVGPMPMGDSSWQGRVWRQIAREEGSAGARRYWILGGAFAGACAIIILVFALRSTTPSEPPYVTAVTLEKGPVAMRGDAQIGDTLRTLLNPSDELRIYRGSELVFRCSRTLAATGCTRDGRGSTAAYRLATAGEYKVIVVSNGTIEPLGSFDRDLAAIVEANVTYRIDRELSVR